MGHILALSSITATTGAKVQGQLLARNGAVTLDTNTITNVICATTPTVIPPVVSTTTAPVGNVVTTTVTGGQLPKTSTPLYELLLIGAALTLLGAVGWRSRKRYE